MAVETDGKDLVEVLESWDGYVSAIGEETFEATLANDHGEIGAEIPLDLLSDDDRAALSEGSLLTFKVGTAADGAGRAEVALVKVAFTEKDIERAKVEAEDLVAAINWA